MTGAAWRRALIIAAAAAAIVAAALLLPRPQCLSVRNGSGRVVAAFILQREDPVFTLSWVHSVMLVPCVEYFRRGEGGQIELYRTDYRGLGAGLPFGDEGGTVTLKDGWIIIDGMRRTFSSITLMTTPIAPHTLTVGQGKYQLLELLGGEHKAVFTIERMPLGTLALVAAARER